MSRRPFTLTDLEKAERDLQACQSRHADSVTLSRAKLQRETIFADLKERGQLPR